MENNTVSWDDIRNAFVLYNPEKINYNARLDREMPKNLDTFINFLKKPLWQHKIVIEMFYFFVFLFLRVEIILYPMSEKYVRFYCDQKALIHALPPEVVKDLLLAALAFKDDGTEPASPLLQDPRFEPVWLSMKPRLEDEHNKYLQKVENAKAAAAKRAESKQNDIKYSNSRQSQSDTLCQQSDTLYNKNKNKNKIKKDTAVGGKVIHISNIPDRCTKCGGLVVRSVGAPDVYKCVDCNTLWSTAPP